MKPDPALRNPTKTTSSKRGTFASATRKPLHTFEFSNLQSAIWNLESGIWNLESGIWNRVPMIYLDNAATSFPKPEPVYQALDRFARTSLANPGRAGHRMAVAAERMLDETRHRLNQFFGGEAPERWVLTMNCTDGLNLAIKGLIRPGDHVVTTDLEHNSVSRPLRALEKAGVITLTRVASVQGYIDPEAIRHALRPNTALVVMTHASNVLGTVQPD